MNHTYSPASNRQPTSQNIKISGFHLRRKWAYKNIWQKKKVIKTGEKSRKFKKLQKLNCEAKIEVKVLCDEERLAKELNPNKVGPFESSFFGGS